MIKEEENKAHPDNKKSSLKVKDILEILRYANSTVT
jgi:hypothetical protein